MPSPILLICNPIAGGNARPAIQRAERYLRDRGYQVEIALTQARGDARRFAEQARGKSYHRIIVAGGDGTLNEVVNGLAPCTTPLAFLPLGTTNVLALEIGLPRAVEQSCRVALEGSPRPVCLGLADETRFLLMAGIGFDAQVVAGVNANLKKLLGKGAYVVEALAQALRHRPQEVRACLSDGRILTGYGAIISNARCYGGSFQITPRACLSEESLEVFILRTPGLASLVKLSLRMLLRRPVSPALGEIIRTREVSLSGDSVSVQLDGDFWGYLPLHFTTSFGEITLVFPSS
ncbi:MAG: diacylglycerol kinase family protein [Geoalkalibacter sp.]|jgi:YegS/Rv2252/BmrU family lipid kinase|uniref:diacylglycerol/lipid kinase family protein n=1 Tax=Geoalkalibacter sp. TaxID=3041440 RepID=UPI002A9F4A3B|nr:diacylglycerol kinase family lipid kinase [Thermodesulfobacteriota bacterium]